jgi:hypothetical protein
LEVRLADYPVLHLCNFFLTKNLQVLDTPQKKTSHLGAKKCFKANLTVNAGLGISIFISGDGMHGE